MFQLCESLAGQHQNAERSCFKWNGIAYCQTIFFIADAKRLFCVYGYYRIFVFRKLVNSEGSFKVLFIVWFSRPQDVLKVTEFLREGLTRLPE